MSSQALPSALTERLQVVIGETESARSFGAHDRHMGRGDSDGGAAVAFAFERTLLAAAAAHVERLLPWRSSLDGRPRAMRVLETGYLEHDHPLFPTGTPYVAVGVDSWEAALAVRTALRGVARLDDASWDLDWESGAGAFRRIQLFPDLGALTDDP